MADGTCAAMVKVMIPIRLPSSRCGLRFTHADLFANFLKLRYHITVAKTFKLLGCVTASFLFLILLPIYLV
ncbi:MAG: hypothetical protein K2K60_06985 [Clostridia bacterium]|nr:hypothetical protein [Clostridia bacterium]